MTDFASPDWGPGLAQLIAAVRRAWPEHETFLRRRFVDGTAAELDLADRLADLMIRLAGAKLDAYCADYRWVSEMILEEELHFRRTGNYRRFSFDEVYREIYANHGFMDRYLNGLLLSQVLWSNQFHAVRVYLEEFLPGNRNRYRHLEIGPGHGLLLHFAAADPRCVSVSAWDVSPASIAMTRHSLDRLRSRRDVKMATRDITAVIETADRFDSIVLSEVLEHLERPDAALSVIRTLIEPDGRLFLNVPVNSPAPDHIALWRRPEEVSALVADAGFRAIETRLFPATGYDEARARRSEATISCVVIAAPVH